MDSADNSPDAADIPDEYLLEIGRIVTRWSILESTLDLCLMQLSGRSILDPRSTIIFNHMAFPMKMDILGAFIDSLLPNYPRLSEYKDIIKKLGDAQKQRNLAAHSKWGMDNTTKQVLVSNLTSRGKLKTSVKPISVNQLKEAADLITDAARDLYLMVVSSGDKEAPQRGQ
jgi:hypothetical protein